MNQMPGLCLPPSQPGFTPKQGQYLAFIHAYTLVLGRPPAEADLQRFFQVTPPSYQVPMKATHVRDFQSEADVIHRGKRRGFAMAAAIGVRGDYDAGRLRELAKRSGDANQTRRLLALAAICDGGSRSEAAKLGGVGLQTVRDWVLAFNAEGPAGLVNGKAPGKAPLLTPAHRQALLEIVESGPIPAVHGVVRWRLIDLAQWLFEEFRISISKQTLSRELRALGLRKLSARPRHHAQDSDSLAAFKKTSPRASTRSPSATRRASR